MINRCAPHISDFSSFEFPFPIQKEIINNNGHIIPLKLIQRGTEPVCRLSILWKKPDGTEKTDADVIMTRMLREGTEKFTGSEIEDILDYNGAWMNFQNNYNNIVLSLYCISNRLPDLLSIINSMITVPSFPEDRLKLIKEKEIDAIRLRNLKVSYVAERELFRKLFGTNHPRAFETTIEGIQNINSESLKASYNKLISSIKPQVWIGGNINPNEIKDIPLLVDSIKGKWDVLEKEVIIQNHAQSSERISITVPNSSQCAVTMGLLIPQLEVTKYIKLKIAVTVLGGYFGSRLNLRIREDEGLTYGINSSITYSREGGLFMISAQATKDNINQLIESTKIEIRKMAEEKITEEELKSARRFQMSLLANLLESPFSLLELYMGMESDNLTENFLPSFQDILLSITPEDIKNTIAKYLNPELLTVIVAGNI